MSDITVDILLEFLYNEFAVTFVFCCVGSWIREAMRLKKKDESKILNIKRIVTSTVFSTFLMCACAGYIDLPFEVYAAISVICGMWGLVIINVVISGKFMNKVAVKIAKKISDPILKSAVEVASEYAEEQEKQKEKDLKDNKDENQQKPG